MSNEQKVLSILSDEFLVDAEIQTDWSDYEGIRLIVWSEERENADDLIDKLLGLEEHFNELGYELVWQDDNDYFGGVLIPIE